MPSILPIVGLVATLAAIEGLAWWWMNPPAAEHGQPVLVYRPGIVDRASKIEDDPSSPTDPPSSSSSPNLESPISNPSSSSSLSTLNSQLSTSSPPSLSTLNPQPSTSSTTPLPDIYRQAAPMLRCSTGEVFRIDTQDHLTLHLAWFEWNDTDTGSVLEAFRHMPEACMGAIGLKLISKEKPIPYKVGLALRASRQSESEEIRDRGSEIVDHPISSSDPQSTIHNLSRHSPRATADPQSPISSTAHRSSITDHSRPSSSPNLESSISNPSSTSSPDLQSPISNLSLSFDHTVFEDPASSMPGLHPSIHSFRAVWVSGMNDTDARRGIRGQKLDQLRTIRLNAAATRYRPTHARVIQGTVRGALNAEAAWKAFEQHMLRHLTLET